MNCPCTEECINILEYQMQLEIANINMRQRLMQDLESVNVCSMYRVCVKSVIIIGPEKTYWSCSSKQEIRTQNILPDSMK